MESCTRWWVRRCLKSQARKNSCQTFRWPTICPGRICKCWTTVVFGPLPTSACRTSNFLFCCGSFSPVSQQYGATATYFTAECTTDLINRYVLAWRCPLTLFSDDGSQFCARLSAAVYSERKKETQHELLPPRCKQWGGASQPHHD